MDMIPMHHFSCICFLRDVFFFTEAKIGIALDAHMSHIDIIKADDTH